MIELLRMLVAPLVWLAAFSGVYAIHGLGCALDWSAIGLSATSLFRLVLLTAWGLAIGMQVMVLVALRSPRLGARSPFIRRTSLVTAWVGLVATLWTLAPVALTSSCL